MRNRLSLLAALSAGFLSAGAFAADPVATAAVGKPAPAFALKDETGKTHSLAQYKGKTVVLEWTNPDCPFVKRHYEADTMQKVLAGADPKQVVWLAVDSTSTGTPERDATFKKAEGFTWPVLQDKDGKVGRAFGARTTPHMFVIDGTGVVRYAGAIDDDPRGANATPNNYVRKTLQSLSAGTTIDPSSTTPYGCTVKYGS
ncbi:MAG: redoxin domain-containing protein [Myxococcaceae bacterium]|nr:redoxin domain-containing protein [Myxococcaceae bacterium]MCI0673992.1 redoxin domain-containing protein [Myxococcaceae bacterium]